MSNTNKVACFYAELKENSKNKLFTKQCFELIDYWKKSWKSNGWNTVVLDEEYIKDEEYYKLLEFDRFYDSNLCKHTIDFSCEYSRACYMRWLAYYKYAKENGDIFWCDYDVINYGLTPENNIKTNNRLTMCNSAGKMNENGGKRVLDVFLDFQKGKYNFNSIGYLYKHQPKELENKISDMLLNSKYVKLELHKPPIMFVPNAATPIKDRQMPYLIHYHNGIFSPESKPISISSMLHKNGVRCSRLEAISIIENVNNMCHY